MSVHNDFQLSDVLWYKIGGKVRYLLDCLNKEDVFQALDFVEKNNIRKIFVVGLGSNLLFTDSYFDGAVVRIASVRSDPALPAGRLSSTQGPTLKKTSDNYIEAFTGETLDNLVRFAFDHNYIGLEWAGGLPGTIGAAVRGNVGAFGGEIKDTVFEAEVLKLDGGINDIVRMSHSDLDFSYRNSMIKKDKQLIVISATFILSETDLTQVEKAREVYHSKIKYREEYHPVEYPNCGSVFKNIVKKDEVEKIISAWPDIKDKSEKDWHGKIAMGYIINRLGFSGFQIGNAQVSPKHANFVVNLGGAKFADVVRIIEEIKTKFFGTFGFAPELEVEIVNSSS